MIQYVHTVIFLLLITPLQTVAQSLLPDSTLINRGKEIAQQQYRIFEGVQSRLYNGKLYRDYTVPLSEGHPYFSTDKLETGKIRYDGILYEDVPLLYNIVTDEVITLHYNKIQWVSLRKDKIDFFNVGGNQFLSITADSLNKQIASGIYQALYDGPTTALKKKSKFVVESISNNLLLRSVKITERYYLWHGDGWHQVNSLRSVLLLLNGHNAAIRQHLRSANIKYRKNPDLALATIAAFYDQITTGK